MGFIEFLLAKQINNFIVILTWLIIFMLLGVSIMCVRYILKIILNDWLILFDKTKGVQVVYCKLRNSESVNYDGKMYPLSKQNMYPFSWGRKMVFKKLNRPEDLVITDKTIEWLESDTLHKIMKNEEIRKVVTPKKDDSWMMILLIVGGVILLIIVVFMALKMFGVIK